MGRKRLPESEKREKPLRILLRADERRTVDAAARAEGKTTSAWAREVLLTSARRKAGKRRT